MKPVQQPQSNDLAIASLVLGILSLAGAGPFTGIPAIITGVMGMRNPYNKGLAVAGLIMGIISTVLLALSIALILLLIFLGVFASSSVDPNEYPDSSEPSDSSYYQQRA